jgi:Arc/MetJ-type ribon-helix-helix transcriptional regulator
MDNYISLLQELIGSGIALPQQKAKYTTVSIPVTLHDRVEKLIVKKTGFKSVSDYVTYVLREVVAMHETKEVPEPFTSQDIVEIKERLTALGYL